MHTSIGLKVVSTLLALIPNQIGAPNKEEINSRTQLDRSVAVSPMPQDFTYSYQNPDKNPEMGKKLTNEANFLSSYPEDSQISAVFRSLTSKFNSNTKIDSTELVNLFSLLESTPHARIGMQYIFKCLQLAKDEDAVDTTLNFVIKQNNLDLQIQALSFILNNNSVLPSKKLQARLALHENKVIKKTCKKFQYAELREQALKNSLPAGKIVEASAHGLRPVDYELGREIRLAQNFWKTLEANKYNNDLMLPLFHNLIKIERRYPGLISTLESQHPKSYDALVSKVYQHLESVRSNFAKTVIIEKGMPFLTLLHQDPEFKDTYAKDLAKQLELGKTTILKPSGSKEDLARVKSTFLDSLSSIAKDQTNKQLVWTTSHGGPLHIWLTGGQVGEHKSDDLTRPDAISYKEIAQALLKDYLPDLKSKKISKVDLSHLIFIADQCIQYNMIHSLASELQSITKEHGGAITKLPILITPAQDGMVGYKISQGVSETFLQAELSKVIDKKPSTNKFTNSYGVVKQIPDTKEITISDFLEADQELARQLFTRLETFTEPIDVTNAGQNERYPVGQNPAIFSNDWIDLNVFLEEFYLERSLEGEILPNLDELKDQEIILPWSLLELGQLEDLTVNERHI